MENILHTVINVNVYLVFSWKQLSILQVYRGKMNMELFLKLELGSINVAFYVIIDRDSLYAVISIQKTEFWKLNHDL